MRNPLGKFQPHLLLAVYFSLSVLPSSQTVVNNLEFRINSAGQIQAGRNSNQCISVKADFSSNFKLRKPDKGPIQVLTDTCAYNSSQLFRQVYIEESPEDKFAFCIEKYYRIYGKNNTILNNLYCLFANDKGLVKIRPRLRKYADLVSRTQLHWSMKNVNEHREVKSRILFWDSYKYIKLS